MKRFQFSAPTKVVGGVGVVQEVGAEAEGFGVKKALVVTDAGVVGAGLVEPVVDSLRRAGVHATVFDEVKPDPSVAAVAEGAEVVRREDCRLIVSVGGGSPIDAAKGISIMATNDGSICDYEGVGKYVEPPLPIIAIPTTAGTGSEVTFGAVLTDEERNYKFIVYGTTLVPKVALLDPTMVATAPPSVKVPTGMDALTHAIESYTSLIATPYTEALAIRAIGMISSNLREAVADGENLEAIGNMLVASNVAGLAFATSRLGVAHAMALPLGAFFHVPHGIACTILLPHGIAFNIEAALSKYGDIARAMGESTRGLASREAAGLAKESVQRLAHDIGAPSRLSEAGVKEEAIPQMARDAMKSSHIPVNPREITVDALESLYREAM
jgi:alcohol dehydrogenase class IV